MVGGPSTGVPFTGTLVGSSWDTGEGACLDLGGRERGGGGLECWRGKEIKVECQQASFLGLHVGTRLPNVPHTHTCM